MKRAAKRKSKSASGSRKTGNKAVKSMIVSATGTAATGKVRSGGLSGQSIEQAMSLAIQQAVKDGVMSDSKEVKRRMLAARDNAVKSLG